MEQAKENAKLAFYQNPGYQLERRKKIIYYKGQWRNWCI